MRRGGRERGSVGGGLKRPGCGHKGGKPARGGGERKPGPAPPGEPRAVAGTFLNAPNTQPGKRELEKEEEGREGKKKKPPRTWEKQEAAAYLWLPELEPHPSRAANSQGSCSRPGPAALGPAGLPREKPAPPASSAGRKGPSKRGGRSRLSPFPCRAVGQAGGAAPRQGKKSSLSGNGVFSAVNF